MSRALEGHAMISMFVMYSPLFAKARADPRFQELMERLRKQTRLTE